MTITRILVCDGVHDEYQPIHAYPTVATDLGWTTFVVNNDDVLDHCPYCSVKWFILKTLHLLGFKPELAPYYTAMYLKLSGQNINTIMESMIVKREEKIVVAETYGPRLDDY